MTRALVLFTRSPEAEARAKGLGPNAAPLFRALLDSWVELARRTGTALVVASPEACRRRLERAAVAPGARFLTQRGDRFGDRLADAVARTFEGGARSVVVAGTDVPAIEPADLRRAFEDAESGAVAFGPAGDGGVYLVALGPGDGALCRTIRLRDSRALARLRGEAERRGRRVRLLARRNEIDGRRDAARARRLAAVDPGWNPYRFLLALALRPMPPAADRQRRAVPAVERRRAVPRAPPRAA